MQKTPMIIGVVVLVVIVGFFALKGGNSGNSEVVSLESSSGDTNEEFVGKITDLMKRGQDLTCDFSQEQEGGTVAGTVYMADQGNSFRGDFTMESPEGMFESHVVLKDGFSYVWSESSFGTFAVKSPIDEEKKEEVFSGKDESSDFNQDFTYKCSNWNADPSVLTPPSNIEFNEVGAGM